MVCSVCLPRDCLDVLSRIMKGPNGPLPVRFNCSISVSKLATLPESDVWVILCVTPPVAAAVDHVNPSKDNSKVTNELANE